MRDASIHGHRRRWARILAGAGLGALLALPATSDTTAAGRGSAVIIPVHGEINDVLKRSVEKRLEQARERGASTIIFEMDTPGGMVTSALDICRLIKNLPQDVRTVAWVHNEAYSAGAMISLACREIWMSPASSIGDCAPIVLTPVGGVGELGETERAKAESPVLQEFRDSASRNHYDPVLVRAMVSLPEEVWWIQHAVSGERRFVTGADKKRLLDDAPAGQAEWKLVESLTDPLTGQPRPVTQPVDSAKTLLTLSQSEAVAFGLARGIVATPEELARQLDLAAAPVFLKMSGWEKFILWLNSPLVRGILLVIVLVGGYLEFQHPGLILPGSVALVALIVFLGAPYAAGLADIWTLIALLAGIILLAVELFVLPGFGVAGVLGIGLILLGVIASFVPSEPNAPPFAPPSLKYTWDALKVAVIVVTSSLIISIAGILLLLRYFPQLPVGRRFILPNPSADAVALSPPHAEIRVGDVGIVTGDLRPGGQARFGDEIVDVMSQGEYIEAGRQVQVLRREGNNIIVRRLPQA